MWHGCRYCLRYYSDIWGHTASNKKHRRSLQLAFLRSQTSVNFGGMPTVKTDMASATSTFCSHIRTVSQAVPAVMSQVAWWHMRTRLYFRVSTGLSGADPFLVTTGHPSRNCRLQWYDCNIFLLFFSWSSLQAWRCLYHLYMVQALDQLLLK